MKTVPLLLIVLGALFSSGCAATFSTPRVKSTGMLDPAEQQKVLEEGSNVVMDSLRKPIDANDELLATLEAARLDADKKLAKNVTAAPEERLSPEEASALLEYVKYLDVKITGLRNQNQHYAQDFRFATERIAMGDAEIVGQVAQAQLAAANAEYESNQAQRSGFLGGISSLGSNSPRAQREEALAEQEAGRARILHAQADKLESDNVRWYNPLSWINLF